MIGTRVLLAAAFAAAALLAVQAAAQGPAVANRAGTSWVYGSGSTQSVAETTSQYYGTLNATEQYDVKGAYESTSIQVYENVSGPTSSGYRYMSCTVDRSAVSVKRHEASVNALLDDTSPSCSQWGYIQDWFTGTYQSWSFPSPLAVSGTWHDARFEQQGTSTGNWKDNLTGSTGRSSCMYGYGTDAQGGFVLGANAYVFGAPTYTGWGSFQFQNCNSVNK